MKTVIIGDMHARTNSVRKLFERIGLIDSEGNRQEGFRVIQMGDRLSLGYFEQEAEFYKWVDPFIDIQLIGNHEWPSVAPDPERVYFGGYENRDYTAENMLRSNFNRGKWGIVTSVGKWLITHAGLHPAYSNIGPLANCTTAAEYAEALDAMWVDYMQTPRRECVQHPYYAVFNAIGAQRSHSIHAPQFGGILWNDISDLIPEYENGGLPQICGHSSYCVTGLQAPDLYCLDTQGGVAALVTEDDGESFDLYIEKGWPKPRKMSVNDLTEEEIHEWIACLDAE